MREKIKTMVLILLFASAITLLYQIYFTDTYSSERMTQKQKKRDTLVPETLQKWILPKKTRIHFFKDDNAIIYDAHQYPFWTHYVSSFKSFSSGIEKLNGKFYTELQKEKADLLKEEVFATFEFDYAMHSLLFAEIYDIKESKKLFPEDFYFQTITVLLYSNRVIFENEKDAVLLNLGPNSLEQMKRISKKLSEDGYVRYYPGSFINAKEGVYTPIRSIKDEEYHYTKASLDVTDEKKIDQFAAKFFSQPIEIIRKIEDAAGNKNFIYENTQLIIQPNGRSKFYDLRAPTTSERTLKKSLETAAKFILDQQESPGDLFLSDYTKIKDAKGDSGYRIVLDELFEGFPILRHQDQEAVLYPYTLDIYGDRVKVCSKYFREKAAKNLLDIEINEGINYTPLEVIEINYNEIKEIIIRQNKLSKQKQVPIMGYVEDIYFSYYDGCNGKKLIPAWVIQIDHMVYVFNMKDGHVLLRRLVADNGGDHFGVE